MISAPPESGNGATDHHALVLIANDQEWTARALETILTADGYQVLRAFTGRQALERALADRPDLVILDRQLPDIDGPEVCRMLRAPEALGASIPVVITTAGPAGRTQRLEAYEAGAWEFLGQPLDSELVSAKLRTLISAKQATDRIQRDALIDRLTGLYTHRGLERRAHEVGSEASRRRQPLACVVLTLVDPVVSQGFNDANRLLVQVSEALKAFGRTADVYGRLDGLEFGIVAPSTTAEGARKLASRVSVAAEDACRVGGRDSITFRTGYCAVSDYGAGEMGIPEMLERARAAAVA